MTIYLILFDCILLFTLDIVRPGDHCLDEVTSVLSTWPGGATWTASQSAPRREGLVEEEEEDGWFDLDPAEHQLEVDLNSVDMVTTLTYLAQPKLSRHGHNLNLPSTT